MVEIALPDEEAKMQIEDMELMEVERILRNWVVYEELMIQSNV